MAHGPSMLRIVVVLLVAILMAGAWPVSAWAPQAHRIVALVAWNHLSVAARHHVGALLDGQSLASVASWADDIRDAEPQTGPWHYVNIPRGAARYERERDCPRPARRADDGWRDCVVDRILQMERQLGDASLDRAVRMRALKFLVHFVGDLHQPLHAIDVARGGTDIPVSVAGSTDCGPAGRGGRRPCTLHRVWDGAIVARRRLNDAQFVARLERAIRANQWRADATGPDVWAAEANRLAARVLVPPRANLDEAYFRQFDWALDEQMAKAGLRLAAVLNRALGDVKETGFP